MKTNLPCISRMTRVLLTQLLAITAVFAGPALPAQTLFVSSYTQVIDKVSSSGTVSVFATLSENSFPQGLAFDVIGNLYVANNGNGEISKITSGGTVSLFATAPANASLFGLATDATGNFYTAGAASDQIYKITPSGTVSVFATFSSGSQPVGLAISATGDLYVTLYPSGQIHKITPGGVMSLFVTLPSGSLPAGLAFDGAGNLYASDKGADKIRKITPSGGVSLFATLPAGSQPVGLAFDSMGNLYAADFGLHQVSKISPDGLSVTTLATGIDYPAYLAVASGPTATPTPACPRNLVINGSFELPGVFGNAGPGRQQYVAPSLISGWTVGGTGDVFLHKCPEMDAGPTFCPAQEGSFYLDLSGSGPPHATVYQDFPTTPGSSYQLSFYIGASIQLPPAPTINVQLIGGATLLNTNVTPEAPGTSINWTLQTFAFVADSPLTRLQLIDTSSDDDNTSFVDNVRVVSDLDPCAPTPAPTPTPIPTPTPPPTGGNGSFVIGDLDAVVGRKVYFWGSQWAKTNRLSGGAAPSAFKGFANSIGAAIPNCGGVWRSDPGNSSGPPNSVPALITVIASSSITKSGSAINGNNRKIVVVRTDPGYGPNPGHEGTGTVISVTCQ